MEFQMIGYWDHLWVELMVYQLVGLKVYSEDMSLDHLSAGLMGRSWATLKVCLKGVNWVELMVNMMVVCWDYWVLESGRFTICMFYLKI
jgi:hypothetical protein